MDSSRAPERASTSSDARSGDNEIDVRLTRGLLRRWLTLARAVWALITALAVTLFIASLPAYYDQLRTACTGSVCIGHQLTPESARSLREVGLSIDFYAAYSVALAVLFASVYLATAAVILWHAPGEKMALLGALMLALFGVVLPETLRALADPLWQLPVAAVAFLGFVSVPFFVNLFPGGRFVPRWTLWAALVWIIAAGQGLFFPGSMERSWVALLNTLGFVCAVGASLGALVYRYLRIADPIGRQQIKWVVFGITAGLGGIAGLALVGAFFPTLGPPGLFDPLGVRSAQVFLLLLIPLSIGAAILRYRLWDIDLIINRTLVYAALTACVVGIYVLIVGYLGALFQTEANLPISLVAAGVVAVLFAPVRERLQHGVDHLTYGERKDPYGALSRLGARLEGTLSPEAVLPTVVQTVRESLKLPYAAVELEDHVGSPVAESGRPTANPLRLSLIHRGEKVGELLLAPRLGERGFSAADRNLLEDLARQAGAAAHAVRLTHDLRRSRERLVATREEERRRLRRDLHDGLGPMLGSLTLKLDVAEDLVEQEPDKARELLRGLKDQAQEAVTDVRRLVHALRPPALDELGLAGAIREQAARYEHGGLAFSVEASGLPEELPAAVEVAAYRIVQEAITNVARHAAASRCEVYIDFDQEGHTLHLEITDDGRGPSAEQSPGVGLFSMRERAEELGGSCIMERAPAGGACVRAELPLGGSGDRQTDVPVPEQGR